MASGSVPSRVPARAPDRSNDEWLRALRADGSEAENAQAELQGLVAGALRKAVARHTRLDAATFDDLVQTAVLQILSRLDLFEGKSRFTTWAYSVAVRSAFTELRKPAYRKDVAGADELSEQADTTAPGPTSHAERKEIVALLRRVIQEDLTPRQRTAILGELRGTPQDELLAELGINRNALYKLLHDARRKLREALCAAGICDHEVREAFDL